MKRLFLYCILIGVLAVPGLPVRAGQSDSRDDDGHSLTALWKVYYKAVEEDKPQDQLKALDIIKSKAKASKLLWDWYDACDRYAQVRISMNWKVRDEAYSDFNEEVESSGEPILRFFHSRDSYFNGRELKDPLQFVKKNATALRKGRHTEFYTRDYRMKLPDNRLGPILLNNDYEYCLWCIADDKQLVSEFKDYPLAAFAALRVALNSDNGSTKELEKVAERYKGKAAGLYAEAEIFVRKFYTLTSPEEDKKVKSEDFAALRDRILDLQKRRDAFKGEEKSIAALCTGADGILEELNSKEIRASIDDGALTVKLRNLPNVNIRICDGKKTVFEKYLTNPVGSYYLEDALRIDLPAIDDGAYKVKCSSGDVKDETNYDKYTISLSTRANSSGIGIWATDYISGEPLRDVTLELVKGDTVLSSSNLTLNGYTPVPAEMQKLVEKYPYECSFRVRSKGDGFSRISRNAPASLFSPSVMNDDRFSAVILTDRGAYNPDEKLFFKAVIYQGEYKPVALGKGKDIHVVLKDPEGSILADSALVTNEFGSIAGEFTLTRSKRNGNYRIEVRKDGKYVSSKSIRVDDFVLPTFDLIFDKAGRLIQPVSSIACTGEIHAYSGHSLRNATINYSVNHYGQTWKEGSLNPDANGRFRIEFPTDSTRRNSYDWYSVTVRVTDPTGETAEFQKSFSLSTDSGIKIQTEYFFTNRSEGDEAILDVVAGKKPCWMMVEIYGTDGRLLRSGVENLKPSGNDPARTTVKYSLGTRGPEGVRIIVLYFQNGNCYSKTISHYRENTRCALPLSFSRFLDTTSPGASYTFGIKTLAGVECAATVFDKSTERYMSNIWRGISARDLPLPRITVFSESGCNRSSRPVMVRSLSTGAMAKNATYNMECATADEEAAPPFLSVESSISDNPDIPIRENFANTIAWEPFLRSDKDGNISFSFTNADKLSTYYVQLFAHDALMHNAALRQEMQVTIPVKISLIEPRFLYEGDSYSVRIALSSSRSKDTRGTLKVSILDGSDYRTAPVVQEYSKEVTVPAMDGAVADIPVSTSGLKTLGIKAVFVPESGTFGSDGVFVSVPVRKAEQTLSEGHSAVLLSGSDKVSLEASLRAMFVNVDGNSAVKREISILNMLQEAIPSELEFHSENALALSSSLLAYELCRRLGQEPSFDRDDAVRKLLACRCDGGGFAWFPGMTPSCLVTAVVLERLHGLGIIDETSAIQWIDGKFFRHEESGWRWFGLSMEQYLYLRSLYAEVPFGQKTDAAFRKAARGYLVPSKERGLNGRIFAKTRRVLTLENLLASDEGTALARKMGIRLGAAKKMRRSLDADVASLVQYAQTHGSGGVFFPNAVMPWRGLLESELYAHTKLCSLMERRGHGDIADGVRLWMMLQKETQHWENDPAYIDAIACVLDGPESVLQTKVLALRAEYTKPFAEIKAVGNGMGISAIAETATAGSGDSLRVGSRISLKWEISSEENRSFVRISLPYNAGLTPVNQLSGYKWDCYRNVLADRIELWYEVLPEGKITITEDFYVSRAGIFQCPASEVVCNYAPHYTANTACPAPQSIVQ